VVGLDLDVRTRSARLNRLIATPREAARIQRAVHDFDVRAFVAEVRAPTLIVHLADSATGVANARWLADHLPDAEYVELSGYYLPTAEEARAVGDRLVEFIRRPDPAR
jgi:hypothetical protein